MMDDSESKMISTPPPSPSSNTLLASPSMEALAQDLHSALEESALAFDDHDEGDIEEEEFAAAAMTPMKTPSSGRRRSWRRRCKSTSNLSVLNKLSSDEDLKKQQQQQHQHQQKQSRVLSSTSSDSSSSDLDDEGQGQGQSSSKTPNRSASFMGRKKRNPTLQRNHTMTTFPAIPGPSTSTAYSSIVRPCTKRKRKFKRMALDPTSVALKDGEVNVGRKQQQQQQQQHKQQQTMTRNNVFGGSGKSFVAGKRKRSNREKSQEPDRNANRHPSGSGDPDLRKKVNDCEMKAAEDDLEEGGQSQSSSSEDDQNQDQSESEVEADDEQSDWPGYHPHGGGGGTGSRKHDDDDDDDDELMEDDVNIDLDEVEVGHFDLTETAKNAYLARMKRLAECVPGREIRAGARRLRAPFQAGFTIKSSSSEQLSRFLQDSDRAKLKLSVLRDSDRAKILHLANLYSLSVAVEDGEQVLVLAKTAKTVRMMATTTSTTTSESSPSMKSHPVEVKRQKCDADVMEEEDSNSGEHVKKFGGSLSS